jgi:hypothetical protein
VIVSKFVSLIAYSLAFLIYSLYLISTKGFDVALNRISYIDDSNSIALKGYSTGVISAFIGFLSSLKIPLTLYNGLLFHRMYFLKTQKLKLYIFFILISSFLDVLATGGRASLINTILFFLLGIFISQFKGVRLISTKSFFRKLSLMSFGTLIFISFYINFISSKRFELSNSSSLTKDYFSKSIVGANFYGVMEYSIFHYIGYQLRLSEIEKNNYSYGQYTFQFITTFNLPVFSQLFKKELNLKFFLRKNVV